MLIGSLKQAAKLIKKYDKIVIFHHIRPDGDCLGSQLGLREVLKATFPKKHIFAIGDSKNMYNFLQLKHDKIPSEEFMKEALAIIVDANFKERIEFKELLTLNSFKETLRIDHHPNEDDLDNCFRWVDSSYIAAAEMVAEMCISMKWKMPVPALNALYLGIHTDSGRLQFPATSSKTLRTVAKLMDMGAERNKIVKILSLTSLESIKYNSFLLNKMETKNGVASVIITLEDLAKYNKTTQNGMYANAIGNIEGYPVWVTFLQESENAIRTEFRSNGPVIRDVAVKWGGGGHAHASGTILKSFNDIPKVIDDLIVVVKNFESK
ncbi:DHH family phosphoesterase [Mycoplasma phocimorsus]|uniref:Bifunctional oligoribonuclease/PAP phosphatase NrnA n=1 Tax=Mycoplasma phocimorsus TaxID=3045839 RepID=A0AAJ1UWY8_9MOLU|nr:bifunctional oligoribonuclease/PAP phosphatase NrnA [Mycoplasma phocimorsus]MDJ1645960.1 bifunctional oligoribonuclease/PAP phosphatase NrnA [Mycoplasma phocimorsus]MDJ1646246.1 bifunctional oligoribonuclease/PAP phosphatase NrnA [Mycoplasma phocimorsus]MDJ1646848.1 bifunctional oligoribonuclease/PAP phosphatase NrnA [Mycoplasma phocimorsus]MDJ1647817.1 bifunctional oligoribonuclease/PAP phosphatase NrnA [Mycoplasma phocimorsus]MDJ1648621.1 bifunctional oligoribonuclease/PAP phosphatase Nrn